MLHRRSDIAHGDIAAHRQQLLAERKAGCNAERNEAPMAVGESPAVARHRLRRALREAREAKGLTQRQVAAALEWSMAKFNRIEAGDVTISRTDLQALLRLLEVTDPEQVQELTEQARTARQRGWWDEHPFHDNLTPAMIQAAQFELVARTIRAFHPNLVPGLLQTREYATAILADLGRDHLAEEKLAARLAARLRQSEYVTTRPDPPEHLLVLDQSVLSRVVGGPHVMSDQLLGLRNQAETGRITVRVLPLAPMTNYAAFGLFTIYEGLGKEVALLYRENYEADEAVVDPYTIDRHRRLFEQLWEQSLGVEQSISLIEERAAALRKEAMG